MQKITPQNQSNQSINHSPHCPSLLPRLLAFSGPLDPAKPPSNRLREQPHSVWPWFSVFLNCLESSSSSESWSSNLGAVTRIRPFSSRSTSLEYVEVADFRGATAPGNNGGGGRLKSGLTGAEEEVGMRDTGWEDFLVGCVSSSLSSLSPYDTKPSDIFFSQQESN